MRWLSWIARGEMMKKLAQRIGIIFLLLGIMLNSTVLMLAAEQVYDFEQTASFQRDNGDIITTGETVRMNETTEVAYSWQISDDIQIIKGDKMTFNFPQELLITGSDERPVLNESGDVIGNTKVNRSESKVIVVFTDYYQKNPEVNRQGSLFFTTKFDVSQVNVGENLTLTVGKTPTMIQVIGNGEIDNDEQLAKWGETINDGSNVNWTVRVNYKGDTIKNAVFEDRLGANQEIEPGDLVSALYGHYEEGVFIRDKEISKQQVTFHDDRKGFTIDLGDLGAEQSHVEINYHSRTTDNGASISYQNKGKLTGVDYQEVNIDRWTPETTGGGSGSGNDILGGIKVTTHEKDSPEILLAGATFQVLNRDGETVGKIVTEKNGVGVLGELIMGEYTLVETEAPVGYDLDNSPIKVKVKKNVATENIVEVDIAHSKTQLIKPEGGIKVIKSDDSNRQHYLADAHFEVRNSEGTIVGTIVTTKNGMGELLELPLGEYTLIETQAPKGYELVSTPIVVEVNEDAKTDNISIVKVTNKKLPVTQVEKFVGKIHIVKVDEQTSTRLAGAEFDIFDEKNKLVDHLVTDRNGEAWSKALVYGDYDIVETKAPKGYLLSNT